MLVRRLPFLLALVLAPLWGLVLGGLNLRGDTPVIERLEATLTDFRMLLRGPTPAFDGVRIVSIDDKTVEMVGRYPLPRDVLARLITEVARHRPTVIAIDLLLVDEGDEATDRDLAAALSIVPTVIAGAAVFPPGPQATGLDGPFAGIPLATNFLLPLPRFQESAALGIVNVATDRSGVPRHVPMLLRTADRIEAALPLRVAALATGGDPVFEEGKLVLGNRTIRTDIGHRLPLAFYGPHGTIGTVSGAAVLAGQAADAGLADRIVVIGATVTGGGDVFPTPFDPVLPGVEVMATAISHIVTGDGPVRDRQIRQLDLAIAIILPMAFVWLIAWRRNLLGLGAAAILLLLAVIGNVVAFANGVWLSAALPLAAAAPPAILFGISQLWQGRSTADHFRKQSAMLQRIQAAGMSRWLARDPGFLSVPVRQDAAVVFVDLSGFTGLSEELGPVETRELLDSFYDLVDRTVTDCNGVVTSFMGDGAMLLFGLPKPTPEDAANAARCGVRLCRELRAWLDRRGETRIGYKVGVHFGPVVASRLGHGDTQQIAATGDTVNTASRLMEFAAANGAEMAVSSELLAIAGRDQFDSGSMQGPLDAHLRGRSGTLTVWLWRGETMVRPDP